MTNEELKKKIIEIVLDTEITGIKVRNITGGISMAKAIADALIAAGIGDVSEYKEKLKLHRVFVRKDGGDVKVLYGNKEVDEIVKEREEYKHRAEKEEKLKNQYCRALLNLARRYVVKTNMTLPPVNESNSRSVDIEMLALYIMANECEQAEKELAEENSGKKKI